MKSILSVIFILLFLGTMSSQTAADEKVAKMVDLITEKKYDEALVLIENAIEEDSSVLINYIHRADVLIMQGRVEESMNQYGQLLEMDSTYSLAYASIALIYSEINDLENALTFYDLALRHAESDSLSFSYYVDRASTRGFLRDLDGSIKDLEFAYRIDSTDISLRNNLSIMYKQVGRDDDAIAMLKQTVVLVPDELEPTMNLAWIYSEVDSLEQSMVYFQKALELAPADAYVLNNTGFLYYKMEDYDKALDYINRSLGIIEYNSYAYRNRGLVYLALEKFDEACNDLATSDEYEFHMRYGNEVKELIALHCEN